MRDMFEIYTDGSCLGNPGPGGWGAISDDFQLCGSSRTTTNNQMEVKKVFSYFKTNFIFGKYFFKSISKVILISADDRHPESPRGM